MAEEDVNFSIGIDLLQEHPFFETRSYVEENAEVAAAIDREIASYFWLLVPSAR